MEKIVTLEWIPFKSGNRKFAKVMIVNKFFDSEGRLVKTKNKLKEIDKNFMGNEKKVKQIFPKLEEKKEILKKVIRKKVVKQEVE